MQGENLIGCNGEGGSGQKYVANCPEDFLLGAGVGSPLSELASSQEVSGGERRARQLCGNLVGFDYFASLLLALLAYPQRSL